LNPRSHPEMSACSGALLHACRPGNWRMTWPLQSQRLFPRASALSVANIETFVTVAIFSGVGLLLSLSALILDKYTPGEWFWTQGLAGRASGPKSSPGVTWRVAGEQSALPSMPLMWRPVKASDSPHRIMGPVWLSD
jgi:hypothetical protein